MKTEEILKLAEQFLITRSVEFVKPGSIIRQTPEIAEARFLIPEALDPNVVIDPCDIRVLVSLSDGRCELVHQM